MRSRWMAACWIGLAACGPTAEQPAPDPCEGDGALATCLEPTQPEAHYVEQGLLYFDTLDGSADPNNVPDYAELAARFEWPPWLKLTGYGAEMIPQVDKVILLAFPDTTVPERDCRAFGVQPFGRCKVVMQIEGKPCPIYEEFTFNDQGEVTFVEAWSDLPGMRPMTDDDPWAEAAGVNRLSTRVPGLGTPTGRIDPTGPAMTSSTDADVQDLAARLQDFWPLWMEEYTNAGDDLYERGCGW